MHMHMHRQFGKSSARAQSLNCLPDSDITQGDSCCLPLPRHHRHAQGTGVGVSRFVLFDFKSCIQNAVFMEGPATP